MLSIARCRWAFSIHRTAGGCWSNAASLEVGAAAHWPAQRLPTSALVRTDAGPSRRRNEHVRSLSSLSLHRPDRGSDVPSHISGSRRQDSKSNRARPNRSSGDGKRKNDVYTEGSQSIYRAMRGAMADPQLRSRIATWGLAGDEFSKGARQILRMKASSKLSHQDAVSRLIARFWEVSRDSLEDCIDERRVNDYWNGNALASIKGQDVFEEIPRQFIASFLAWLEGQFRQADIEAPFIIAHLQSLQSVADVRFPSLDYGNARTIKRNIHLHVGPTNSGKTHGALVALCKASTGVYAGPLRLLAHEVWDRINSGAVSPGIPPRPCNLLTGEESKVMDENASLLACTVEMLNSEDIYDVAVIDEIQMIGDPQRGYAWTAAVLGLAAKEVHLCGEKSVVGLITQMAKACGDNVHVHEYERLTPLRTDESIGSLKNVEKGDCVVAFSRSTIFQVKEEIERETGLRCAVAYGSLPPETKAEQAKIFNDPNNNVDVIVASDAIGMGLNLKIKRVIFTRVTKWNGKEMVQISNSQLKQIAGRAGRFDSKNAKDATGGIATTVDPDDLPVLQEAIAAPLMPITHAAIQAGEDRLNRLATLLPAISPPKATTPTEQDAQEQREVSEADQEVKSGSRPYSELVKDITYLTRIDPTFYFADALEQQDQLAPIVESALPSQANLTLSERVTFSKAPVNLRDDYLLALMGNMARMYAHGKLITFEAAARKLLLLDALEKVEKAMADQASAGSVDPRESQERAKEENNVVPLDVNDLMMLESLHRGVTLYMWLAMRFPTSFSYAWKAETIRERTERAIDACLEAIRMGRKRRMANMALKDRGHAKNDRFPSSGRSHAHGKHNMPFEGRRKREARFEEPR